MAAALRLQVLDGMTAPADLAALSALSDEERLRWYVANVVDYHRSEAKPAWWEYFSRCANADTLAESDNKCIGDLTFEPTSLPINGRRSETSSTPTRFRSSSIASRPATTFTIPPRKAR